MISSNEGKVGVFGRHVLSSFFPSLVVAPLIAAAIVGGWEGFEFIHSFRPATRPPPDGYVLVRAAPTGFGLFEGFLVVVGGVLLSAALQKLHKLLYVIIARRLNIEPRTSEDQLKSTWGLTFYGGMSLSGAGALALAVLILRTRYFR